MTEDKKQSDEITPAGAVELEETALDQASGGTGEAVAWKLDPASQKVTPENKYSPAQNLPGQSSASGDFHIKFQGP